MPSPHTLQLWSPQDPHPPSRSWSLCRTLQHSNPSVKASPWISCRRGWCRTGKSSTRRHCSGRAKLSSACSATTAWTDWPCRLQTPLPAPPSAAWADGHLSFLKKLRTGWSCKGAWTAPWRTGRTTGRVGSFHPPALTASDKLGSGHRAGPAARVMERSRPGRQDREVIPWDFSSFCTHGNCEMGLREWESWGWVKTSASKLLNWNSVYAWGKRSLHNQMCLTKASTLPQISKIRQTRHVCNELHFPSPRTPHGVSSNLVEL